MSVVDLLTDEHEHQRQTQRVVGVAVGIVTHNQDPQGLGRVKVKFPWLSDGTESDWTKIVSFMSGNDRGAVFLPEVNDEVLVAFEHGDINFPYVLGGLWNSKDPPPEKNQDGRNNIRKIRSRSGHEIIFRDDKTSRQEELEIRTNAGHSILLSDAAGAEQVVIKDKSGNNLVKIDSLTNSIHMESLMKISIKSNIVEIKADTVLTITANAALTIQGTPVKIN